MFILDGNDPVPLYRQLYNQIRERILSGRLPADAKLPSVRDLAAELATSRNTVEGAYQELYAEGYLYSRHRSGYFVSALTPETVPLPRPRRQNSLRPCTPASYRYDFHPARLDPESFPAPLWRKCYLEALRETAKDLSEYGDPQGEWGLRSAIRHYLERSRGVICTPEQIVICSGLQHSLAIIATLLREDHSAVAVEDPGYHLPRAVFRNHGFDLLPVPVGPQGLDLERLRGGSGTIAYVTPSHQLPIGCVMPIANRLQLIEWAETGGNHIIEDDYDSELRYHGKPIPSLQGLRPEGNIFYLGTFSKVLSPALRLSYLVLPPSQLSPYRSLFRDYFSSTPLLEQRTMTLFMDQGHWGRHVRRMRIRYQKKHDAMLRAIADHFGDRGTVLGQGAGLHVVLELPPGNPGEGEIIRRGEEQGIRLFPFSATCASGEATVTKILLGFGGLTPEEIDQGIRQLFPLCS